VTRYGYEKPPDIIGEKGALHAGRYSLKRLVDRDDGATEFQI
jgi:hypothetical protein